MWDRGFRIVLFVLLGIFAATTAAQLFPLVDETAALTEAVNERVGESGVKHPLTAVLLNFRGYDTMLEIGVLFVAVMASWALGGDERSRWKLVEPKSSSPVLRVALGVLVPTAIMVAGYMVWVGAYRPGGAFQAGTVLGAVWVILIGAGVVPLPPSRVYGVRIALGSGFFLFLTAAVLPSFFGKALLEYPRDFAGSAILAIETTLSVSIGASIGALVAGIASPRRRTGGGEDGIL